MNKKIMTLVAVAAIASLTARGAAHEKLTPEQREQRRYQRTGGFVRKAVSGKSLYIQAAANVKSFARLESVAKEIDDLMLIPVKVSTNDASREADCGAVLHVIDDAAVADVLTVRPEKVSATVNISPLKTADEALFNKRIGKEVWRALGFMAGAGYSQIRPTVMVDVRSVAELDANEGYTLSPDAFSNVLATMRRCGIEQIRVATFRTACEEGWAPAPTNEVQKAIWDKVHTLPTEPIRILPKSQKK